ncbi:hypothetical protein PILCRDRAFT_824028 [Piloderma croceum F 1598]|uniref:Uncharacterized protein n=1 Tax=Piloderma croceum (strain F 1598) TaxID=765440 RepID=A0A0C3BNK2_PILCF|nr:hypothetical protein PILCRDRAFT_824028 [Piloderma croceum F 1598]
MIVEPLGEQFRNPSLWLCNNSNKCGWCRVHGHCGGVAPTGGINYLCPYRADECYDE